MSYVLGHEIRPQSAGSAGSAGVKRQTPMIPRMKIVKATITQCDLSATILFKLVDSDLTAFKFSHNNVASIQKNRGDKSHRVIVA